MTKENARLALLDAIAKEKGSCFDMLRGLERAPPKELSNAGFKTFEEAARYFVKGSAKKVEQLIVKFERDYPDDEDFNFECDA